MKTLYDEYLEGRRARADSPYVTERTLHRLWHEEDMEALPRPERDHPFAAREYVVRQGDKIVKKGVM